MSEQKNILQRLNAVMKDVNYIQKNRPEGMNYSIVSHDDVTAKVRPSMVEHGIVYYPCNMEYIQVGNRTQVMLDLHVVNIDDKTDFINVACLGFGVDSQDKGPGKAVSYAVKYGLLKALGLKTGDDADLESIEHKENDVPDGMKSAITSNQFTELQKLIEGCGRTIETFCKKMKIPALSSLPASRYNQAKQLLESVKDKNDNA